MKKTFKIISRISILLFGILWILSKLNVWNDFNDSDIRTLLVLIHLFTSLQYFKMEIKDKNAEIQELKIKLDKTKPEKEIAC